jgi:hypothetical protein
MEATELLQQAVCSRRLAANLTDAMAVDVLLTVAAECEAQAFELMPAGADEAEKAGHHARG